MFYIPRLTNIVRSTKFPFELPLPHIASQEAGIDLWKLPYTDVSEARLNYLAEHKLEVPTAKNTGNKKMKNAERLAASTKKPNKAIYVGARIITVREGEEAQYMNMNM